MSDINTRADSIKRHLTGANTNGASQSDPNASLGDSRSSSEAPSYGISISSPIANITVDFASGGNVAGAGSLECIDANTLRWKDLTGSYGASETISNGQSKVLEVSGNPGAYIRVTETSATALVAGTATVTLTVLQNNLFGLDDVSSAEAAAGDAEYRAVMYHNTNAGSVSNFKMWLGTLGTARVSATTQLGASGSGTITIASGTFGDWPASGFCRIETSGGSEREIVYYSSRTSTVLTVPTNGRARLGTSAAAGAASDNIYAVPGIAIGIDPAGVVDGTSGGIQAVGTENTAPGSVIWVTGITSSTGLDIGTMATTKQVGIWIWRDVPIGQVSNPNAQVLIQSSYDAA